jgi:hypothetical protein
MKAIYVELIFLILIIFISGSTSTIINSILTDIMNGVAPIGNNNSHIKDQVEYNSKLRPTGLIGLNDNVNENGSLIINSTIKLNQIVSFDERNQILTTSFYLLISWQDPRLMWNPTEYNNTLGGIFPLSGMWTPDLAILNSGGPTNLITFPSNLNVLITFEGITYLTLSIPSQQTRCKLNVFKYPFDTQKCSIVIGSWMNNDNEITFENDDEESVFNLNLEGFVKHPIWELKGTKYFSYIDKSRFTAVNNDWSFYKNILDEYYPSLNYINYDDFELSSTNIGFELELKRNPLYIMINGIVPSFILNCVILTAFSLPFSSQVGLSKKSNKLILIKF